MSRFIDQKHIAERTWIPHPGPQTEAFRFFWCFEILYGGAKGGGKTDWLLFDFLDPDLISKPNYRGIIFRRTFPRLREIIDRSHQWFSTIAEYVKQDRCWIWPSGAKLYFAHCQFEESKYDYQGHEYQYMGFDQLEEFTQSQYDFLKVQARTSDREISVRIRATANPGNVGHLWVKRRFVDDRKPMQVYKDQLGLTSIFIPAKIYDNPSLIKNDPMYVKRLQSLPEQDRKALLDGDWNIFAGQYFKEWNPVRHIVEPFYIPKIWKRFIAGDYGHKNPSSIGWYAINPEGGIIRYKEIYEEGMNYDVLAERICAMSEEEDISYAVFDPAIFGDKQHHSTDKDSREGRSGAEIIQGKISELRGERSFLVTRADNRRIEGWRTVRQNLSKDGGFKVFSNCVYFITTFPANIHDEKRPEDLDTDGEDHSADEFRYASMSRPPSTDLRIDKKYDENSPMEKMLAVRRAREEFSFD